MADRSTAAVDVAEESGATLDGAAHVATPSGATSGKELSQEGADREAESDPGADRGPDPAPVTRSQEGPAQRPSPDDTTVDQGPSGMRVTPQTAPASGPGEEGASPPPTVLHSGHKLAKRYRLEECVTRSEDFSSWRAVDEMLRRAVGVHILSSGHPRAKRVLAAARSAALLGDPRFVQVLDAVENRDLVYVVHEWLPDATELTPLLVNGPLPPHEADQMVRQLSQAMAMAHREGLSHLRLDPHHVLRTESGQYRIRGLAVAAALYGMDSDQPKREDTRAIGALLYAALTKRWPYPEDAHGLVGLPSDRGLVAPDQVRAGVHRGLSELAIRAFVNDGSTASREEPPCATPEELAKAAAAIPRIRPPELELPGYQRSPYAQSGYARNSYRQPPARQPVAPPTQAAPVAITPPPALPGRTGRALKWAVTALLVTALGLGSWQIADAMLHDEGSAGGNERGTSSESSSQTERRGGEDTPKPQPGVVSLPIVDAQEFDPEGKGQNPKDVGKTYDGDRGSYWRTKRYHAGPPLAPYKDGVGIVYDLGSLRNVQGAIISLRYRGDRTTAALYAADSLAGGSLASMERIGDRTTRGQSLRINTTKPVKTRYVLLWLTEMPYAKQDQFSGSGYKQAITDLLFTGRKQ